ncbi:MAG: hypothetical protein MUF15_23630 [Acidobacteria bacterium]|jgi:hypothetical protein|nr:hypothetical protein [Acidobacteriota bacterium]
MKFDFAIVEDADVLGFAKSITDKALQEYNQQHNKQNNIVFNEELSERITNNNFEAIATKFEKFEGNLIICLDMQLDIIRDKDTLNNIINRFNTDYGITEQQLKKFTSEQNRAIDGLLLAEKAMVNKNAKRILIIPFTKSQSFGSLSPLFSKMITTFNRQKDVFFVENTRGAWTDINSDLCSIPDDNERDNFEKTIIGFITNAVDNFEKKFSDPVEKLSKELIKGCQVNDGHPNSLEEIPKDMVCYEDLMKTESPEENFKALFYWKDSRKIEPDLFSSILKNERIQNNWKNKPTDGFFLPSKPGMIFLICLVDFFKEMHKFEIVLNTLIKENGKPIIEISFELKDPDRFREGIFTGGGTAIEKYRNLLGCKKDIILENFMSKDDKEAIQTDKWYPAPMKSGKCGNSEIYKRLLNGRIEGNRLIISWLTTKPS